MHSSQGLLLYDCKNPGEKLIFKEEFEEMKGHRKKNDLINAILNEL